MAGQLSSALLPQCEKVRQSSGVKPTCRTNPIMYGVAVGPPPKICATNKGSHPAENRGFGMSGRMFAIGSRVAAGSGVHPQGAFARNKPMISGTPAALPCPNLFLFLYSIVSCCCAFNEEVVVSRRFRPPGFLSRCFEPFCSRNDLVDFHFDQRIFFCLAISEKQFFCKGLFFKKERYWVFKDFILSGSEGLC